MKKERAIMKKQNEMQMAYQIVEFGNEIGSITSRWPTTFITATKSNTFQRNDKQH